MSRLMIFGELFQVFHRADEFPQLMKLPSASDPNADLFQISRR